MAEYMDTIRDVFSVLLVDGSAKSPHDTLRPDKSRFQDRVTSPHAGVLMHRLLQIIITNLSNHQHGTHLHAAPQPPF